MTDRELKILGFTCLVFAFVFVITPYPWIALPFMAVGYVCFAKLALKNGGDPPGPIQPA
jgi:phosphatidylserine synthase